VVVIIIIIIAIISTGVKNLEHIYGSL